MTITELAPVISLIVPEKAATATPPNPEVAAFAVAQTAALVRELKPDLVIPLTSSGDRDFGRQVGISAPPGEPLMLRRNEEGCLRIFSGVLGLCERAERVVLVAEVLDNGREAAELITMLGLGERAVGVVALWDKRELEWPAIAGAPVHAVFRSQRPEQRPARNRSQALRAWAAAKISRMAAGISSLASVR